MLFGISVAAEKKYRGEDARSTHAAPAAAALSLLALIQLKNRCGNKSVAYVLDLYNIIEEQMQDARDSLIKLLKNQCEDAYEIHYNDHRDNVFQQASKIYAEQFLNEIRNKEAPTGVFTYDILHTNPFSIRNPPLPKFRIVKRWMRDRLVDCVHRWLHPSKLQAYGFSPVCLRLCIFGWQVCVLRKLHPSKSQA